MVPTEELSMRATLKLSLLEKSDPNLAFEDLLLFELLNWFKLSFFTWVDIPKCQSCGQIPQKSGIVQPNESESSWLAGTVEQYFCINCQTYIRFPRYNHPKKLLETRRGRCGEWARCFILLCRALGYETRLVLDWNDHVWAEVFSFTKNRWLHCDPCEDVCDKPLLYEIGWKKPISYIIAISKDEVQDVTWRYTSNFLETIKRRNFWREEWLVYCILRFTEKLQSKLSSERRQELVKRRAFELVEFLTEPKAEENYCGRSSGSLAWRVARGETQLVPDSTYVFKLTPSELTRKQLHVQYSCALNKYIRVSDRAVESNCWTSCCFHHSNIFRKVETDWKMAYISRTEDSNTGVISWKFCFSDSGLTVQHLMLHLKCATFETGKIKWLVSSESDPNVSKTLQDGKIIVSFYFVFFILNTILSVSLDSSKKIFASTAALCTSEIVNPITTGSIP